MAGLIQCPNCLSMVDSADAFCMLCGHSLAGAVPAAPAAVPADEEPVYKPAEEPAPAPAAAPYAYRSLEPEHKVELKKDAPPAEVAPADAVPAEIAPVDAVPAAAGPTLYCPNGHTVTNPGLGFCAVCGALLVSETPAPAPEPTPAEPEKPAVRFVSSKCSFCGATLYDDGLEFCPNCGNRITRDSVVPLPSWVCGSCGAENDESNVFCLNCGTPRAAAKRAEPVKKHTAPPPRPAGMRPPSDDDLAVKSRGGNWA